jgi:hypothetical protein
MVMPDNSSPTVEYSAWSLRSVGDSLDAGYVPSFVKTARNVSASRPFRALTQR